MPYRVHDGIQTHDLYIILYFINLTFSTYKREAKA